jgi:UDP-N-acetylmuramoylalanine--D-glutamate ligase
MTFENKRVIVVGLAKSGISAIKVLSQIGAKVTVTDIKKADQLSDIIEAIKPYVQDIIVGEHPHALDQYDIAVMSPGVPLDLPFVIQMKTAGIHIIGEIELAYLLCKGKFIGITGTNGKTTTTALTGEIFEASGLSYNVVGNIGLPAVSKALEATEETFMITEISSFQLETIENFHAKVAAVLNLTPDHLNRHKTMENYIAAKARIFENQDETDALVLNYDDMPTRELANLTKSRVHFFSRKTQIGQSAYIENGQIILNCCGNTEPVCLVSDLLIFGRHNEENALAAALICRLAGLDVTTIAQGLKSFKGVEHRIEYTATVEGRKFYNDSKGTNPDSTICAIEAMAVPTHLIAGGYDKDSDFGPMFDVFGDKIKSLILLGATKQKIADVAREKGFEAIVLVESMEEAVRVAFERSQNGDAILLSPACASWDMYDNFEKRGEHFKACVRNLDQ